MSYLWTNPKADTSILEREIDRIVFTLYGLTPDEIRLVEESTPSSGRHEEAAPDSPSPRRGRTASGRDAR